MVARGEQKSPVVAPVRPNPDWIPFHALDSGSEADREIVMPQPAPKRLERTLAGDMVPLSAPEPYNVPGGYFN